MPNPNAGVEAAGNSSQVRTGPGKLFMARYQAGLVLPIAVDSALDAALLPVGFTTEGSELSVSQESDGVVVAERLRELRREVTGGSASYSFAFAQLNPANLARATNATAANTVAPGAGASATENTVRFNFPKVAGSGRFAIVWESLDGLERLVIPKCYSTGTITVPRRKGVDIAAAACEFTVEENSDATIGGGQDMYYLFDKVVFPYAVI